MTSVQWTSTSLAAPAASFTFHDNWLLSRSARGQGTCLHVSHPSAFLKEHLQKRTILAHKLTAEGQHTLPVTALPGPGSRATSGAGAGTCPWPGPGVAPRPWRRFGPGHDRSLHLWGKKPAKKQLGSCVRILRNGRKKKYKSTKADYL